MRKKKVFIVVKLCLKMLGKCISKIRHLVFAHFNVGIFYCSNKIVFKYVRKF